MVNLADVAAKAGLSVSAVSRALSDDPRSRLSESTKQRVRDAAKEVGYRPNFAGRALRLARTDVLALVVPDVTNPLVSELTCGVEDEAMARGYTVLLGRSEDMQSAGMMFDRLLGEGRVDGVILQARDDADQEELTSALRYNAPVVAIHREIDGAASLLMPDSDAARVAVEHLVALGHRRIGFIGGLPGSPTAQRRLAGFTQSMADAGLEIDPAFVTALGYQPAQGAQALDLLLELADRPTAIVVANVNAAIAVLRRARVRGIEVPAELSVVAIHDAWTAENTWPPLSTVRLPLYELGREAVSTLVNAVGGATPRGRVLTSPEPTLVARESTAPIAS